MSRRPEAPSVPSWDDVRFFLTIHRAGSLSRATRALGVTQPTCGRRLAALEESLGVRLFERTPHGLRITRDGEALLDAAARMEEAAGDLALRAAAKDRDLEGVVRIATTEAFAFAFLVGAVAKLREKYPGICTELVLSNDPTDLLGRAADLAFRFLPEGRRPEPASLAARKLGDEPWRLYGTDAYLERRGAPRDPAVLADHDVVVYAAPSPAAAWCARAYVGARVALSAPSMQVVGVAIAAGVGVGAIPARMARAWRELRALSPVVAHGVAWLVVHAGLRRVPRIRATADLLAGLFRADRVL